MSVDLLTETRKLLDADSRSIRQIAEDTGINYHWLGKFKQGKFDDPGVKKIQSLYEYLAGIKAA